MNNPEDKLWGIWERKWFEEQVRTSGLDGARRLLQKKIDEKDNLKKTDPQAYKRRYCGL